MRDVKIEDKEIALSRYLASEEGQLLLKDNSELAVRTAWKAGYLEGGTAVLKPLTDSLIKSFDKKKEDTFNPPFDL